MIRTFERSLARPALAVAIASALTACGGNGDPATAPVVTPPTTPTSNGSATPGIYVTNANNSITVFALDASGNTAPARTIAGASTGLSLPIGMGVDHQGNLYAGTAPNLTVASVRTIQGGATGLAAPLGITVVH